MLYTRPDIVVYSIAFTILFMVQCAPQNEKKGATNRPISEVSHHFELVKDRIAKGNVPTITHDFILAGILSSQSECEIPELVPL